MKPGAHASLAVALRGRELATAATTTAATQATGSSPPALAHAYAYAYAYDRVSLIAAGLALTIAASSSLLPRPSDPLTALLWICSLALIVEFAVAPFNLWSGRTMQNFERFTALPSPVATRMLAPAKLAGAALLAAGLAVAAPSVTAAVVIALVSGFYLVRLVALGRRHPDGLAAFGLTLGLAIAVLALQLSR